MARWRSRQTPGSHSGKGFWDFLRMEPPHASGRPKAWRSVSNALRAVPATVPESRKANQHSACIATAKRSQRAGGKAHLLLHSCFLCSSCGCRRTAPRTSCLLRERKQRVPDFGPTVIKLVHVKPRRAANGIIYTIFPGPDMREGF